MFGNTGYIHAPEKRSKKEIEATMRIDARAHAGLCESFAMALRTTGQASKIADALEQAARFIRHFAKLEE